MLTACNDYALWLFKFILFQDGTDYIILEIYLLRFKPGQLE